MKFALGTLLCALLPFAAGCASPKTAQNESAPTRQDSLPPEPAGSAASLAAGTSTTDAFDESQAKPKPKGPAYLLRMIDYKSGARLELVNESHTAPLEQYSKRGDPARKVTPDEWMDGLRGYLKDNGWSKEVKSGSAPTMARGTLRWSLEQVGPDGTSFVAEPMDAKSGQRTRLRTIQKAFLDTYNATQQFQAVSVKEGQLPFKVPEYQTKKSSK